MYLIPDTAWKFGCGRYIQKPGALMDLPGEIRRVGGSALVLAGQKAWAAVCDVYPQKEFLADIPHALQLHTAPCSQEAAGEYARMAREGGWDVIVGIGGGKIMDLAKMTGQCAGKPVINVPTICATCAAFTPLSVLYTPEGKAIGSWYFEWELQAVLADTAVLARQPVRYAIAGIADSMAKKIETEYNLSFLKEQTDMSFALLNARFLYDQLLELSGSIGQALQRGEASPLIEKMAYLTIPATGIISGLARGNGQSALAHGLYESVRTLFTREAAGFLHGEIVGVGLRLQLAFEGKDGTELDTAMKTMGLPMFLKDLHVPETEETYAAIARDLAGRGLLDRFGDGQERVIRALRKMQNKK